MESLNLFYIIKKKTTTENAFLFQNLSNMTRKPVFPHSAHLDKQEKSHLMQSIVYTNAENAGKIDSFCHQSSLVTLFVLLSTVTGMAVIIWKYWMMFVLHEKFALKLL